MLIKLAKNIDKDVNKGLGVRGTHLVLSNAAHPAVFGGGVVGGFAGKELMKKMIPIEKNLSQRFAHHAGRGLAAGLGAGIGALTVKTFRADQEKK